MLFRRTYEDSIAQAAYLIGCQQTGEAIAIDPLRDIDPLLELAQREGVRITKVTETHIHADYLSGSRELAQRTGAHLLLSAEGGADWQYGFAEDDGAQLLRDGDVIRVDNISLQVRHTPGHTPEHLSFLVADEATTLVPIGLLTGDFLFVGDVGRPDLLEKAAGVADTMRDGARTLFVSLARLGDLPDHLQVWPGHGAGSACGKALGAVPTSTLGYERLVNPALQYDDADAFVDCILADQPEPPAYFAQMKRMNRDGPTVLGHLPDPGRLGAARLETALERGEQVIDLRPRDAFAQGHVPGTIHLPMNRSFTTWAGSLLSYERPVLLLGVDASVAREAARQLALIGIDAVEGYVGPEAFEEARLRGELRVAEVVGPDEARTLLAQGALLLDVRARTEWQVGHVEGAHFIHLGDLPSQIDELPNEGTIAVMCGAGGRSAIAQSLLLASGRHAINIEGGWSAWTRS